jgi:hypothetical protein
VRATFRIDNERLGVNAPETNLTAGRPLASGDVGLDLVVVESGNPGLLAERLAELAAMQVLHLSCPASERRACSAAHSAGTPAGRTR